ncbi:unnamed protein product [Clonostachys rhizophaga]|uniref:RecA family profile 1 domain-containing protein n=1 Tax=Clonostachys rhizophaga TaxID=160324 RepID=A0A9N9YM42_9HYPO|nr:unnamed protein product [Clonostachys rhizophaga]
MSDIRQVLPTFPVSKYANLLPAIEQHGLTTTDLLTLHPTDIAKQTHLPLVDLRRFIAIIQISLTNDLKPQSLSLLPEKEDSPGESKEEAPGTSKAQPLLTTTKPPWSACISTLDDTIDAALGGGIPTGRISEFVGESGAGKTQFLLSLCLAVQLPSPRGIEKQALYISTESGLSTSRLAQMLKNHPVLQNVDFADKPSLDNILSTSLPDLESQDHILHYQLPVLLERHNIGLIILDSVAANYRAEFERQGTMGHNMAARSSDLVKLGALFRHLARKHDLAVVVANQVSDRFASSAPPISSPARLPSSWPSQLPPTQETPLASRSSLRGQALPHYTPSSPLPFSMPPDDDGEPPPPPVLMLDHQQRWFTGWGDDPMSSHALKTPSLGIVWCTQIACRIALFKRPVYGRTRMAPPISTAPGDDYDEVEEPTSTLRTWRRWIKVVFAPHAPASGPGLQDAIEFEISAGGLKALPPRKKKTRP